MLLVDALTIKKGGMAGQIIDPRVDSSQGEHKWVWVQSTHKIHFVTLTNLTLADNSRKSQGHLF